MFYSQFFNLTDSAAFAFETETIVPQSVDCDVIWNLTDYISSKLVCRADGIDENEEKDHKIAALTLVHSTVDHPPLSTAA